MINQDGWDGWNGGNYNLKLIWKYVYYK